MADQHQPEKETETASKGCGMFDFLKKKPEDKPGENVEMADAQNAAEHEVKGKEAEKPSRMEKLHRSDSSSSDEEEVGEDGEKKKKKGLKAKIKEKILGDDKKRDIEDNKMDEGEKEDKKGNLEEKKGLMEKIKEKLPDHHEKAEADNEAEHKEKGVLEKIKEKLPGHNKNEEEKKENKA